METLSSELNLSLTLFFLASAGIITFGGIFLIKIFLEFSRLIGSLEKFMELINYEFVPTIKEVQTTLKHISSISDKADKHIVQLSDGIDTASNKTNTAVNKAKINFLSTAAGIAEGFKILTGSKTE